MAKALMILKKACLLALLDGKTGKVFILVYYLLYRRRFILSRVDAVANLG